MLHCKEALKLVISIVPIIWRLVGVDRAVVLVISAMKIRKGFCVESKSNFDIEGVGRIIFDPCLQVEMMFLFSGVFITGDGEGSFQFWY